MHMKKNRSTFFLLSFIISGISILILVLLLWIFFPTIFKQYNAIHLFGFFILVGILLVFSQYFLFLFIQKKLSYSSLRNQQKAQVSDTQLKEKTLQLALLKDRERYRREFLGNVSHELKTPLFAIQGYLLTLTEGGAIKDKTIRDKYLERINKSVERLIVIVQDLDLMAEIESGNLQLNVTSFSLKNSIQEVLDVLEIRAKQNEVKLSVINQSNDTKALADKEKIMQVITNLVSNAITHSKPEGGFVQVRINDDDENADQFKVEVIDNGVGIETKHLSRIFERFYRTDKARSRDKGGSGLGLAIVKHILGAHQQTIEVISQQGEGTTFTFRLQKA